MADPTRRKGYEVIYPNRYKSSAKLVKLVVFILLLVSAGLMLAVTMGGWNKLEGMKPVSLIWALLYLLIAYYVLRWKRGLLPVAAAGGILLMALAVIAGTGASGTSWFERDKPGYGRAMSIFSTTGFPDSVLGLLTVLLIPVELLLIVFAIQAFSQGWNVEQEVPEDEAEQWKQGNPPKNSEANA